MKWEIFKKGKVFTHPHTDPYAHNAYRNLSHAPSIILMPDDSLLAIWFSGPGEGSHRQALMSSYSSDGGETWNSAEVFQDTYGSPDFDPAFIRDGKRVWLFFIYAPRYTWLYGEKKRRQGCWVRYTDDCGKSWSEAIKVCEPEGPRSNGIILQNGDLLIGVHEKAVARVLKSSDSGNTWKKCGHIVGKYGNAEPTIVELTDDSVLMYLRNGSGYIWKSKSKDGGETWSDAKQTDILANISSHCLYRLHNGDIALSYNPCEPRLRTPLVIRFSNDDTRTWSDPLMLDEISLPEETPGICAVCYPSLAENTNNELVVVWSRTWQTEKECCGDICFALLRRSK